MYVPAIYFIYAIGCACLAAVSRDRGTRKAPTLLDRIHLYLLEERAEGEKSIEHHICNTAKEN